VPILLVASSSGIIRSLPEKMALDGNKSQAESSQRQKILKVCIKCRIMKNMIIIFLFFKNDQISSLMYIGNSTADINEPGLHKFFYKL